MVEWHLYCMNLLLIHVNYEHYHLMLWNLVFVGLMGQGMNWLVITRVVAAAAAVVVDDDEEEEEEDVDADDGRCGGCCERDGGCC